MERGDIVIIAAPGDYGKPRPAVIVQSNELTDSGIGSIVVCLMTSSLKKTPATRVTILPTPANGLQRTTNVMAEKLFTLPSTKITKRIGSLTADEQTELDHALTFALSL